MFRSNSQLSDTDSLAGEEGALTSKQLNQKTELSCTCYQLFFFLTRCQLVFFLTCTNFIDNKMH